MAYSTTQPISNDSKWNGLTKRQEETARMIPAEDSNRQFFDNDDDANSENTTPSDRGNSMKRWSRYMKQTLTNDRVLIIAGLAVLLLVVLVIVLLSPRSLPPATQWSSCGSDPETARTRNCSFDLISFAWQMPECYDGELVEQFASWSNWAFFADAALSMPVSQDQAFKGEEDLYTDHEYHAVHCTFTYRQMQRAYERGRIDVHLRSLEHTLHCQHMLLMNDTESARHFTVARVIYPICSSV